MSQEIKEAGSKHCFACIQWDGIRTYYKEKNQIKVDTGAEGLCRVSHQKIKGTSRCDQFYALK